MTGKYPAPLHIMDWIPGESALGNSRFRLPDWQQRLPLEETTLAKTLKQLGLDLWQQWFLPTSRRQARTHHVSIRHASIR